MPEGVGTFLGRTQLRPPTAPLTLANGALRLQLDTYNPTALSPGDSFWGSEIVSRQEFTPGNRLTFLARVRVAQSTPGMVASLFLYRLRQATRDEIDFEVLTNRVPSGILTNVFRNEGFASGGSPRHVSVPGFVASEFNDFQLEWSRDRVRWSINGQLIREESAGIPEGPMSLRFNLWAPNTDFADAYSPGLQPAPAAADNRSFFYEIDFVEVRAE
jgi:beta-glucanase (GH16 family)